MFHGVITGKVVEPPLVEGEPGNENCEVRVERKMWREGSAAVEHIYINVPPKRAQFLEKAYDQNWSVVFIVADVAGHAVTDDRGRAFVYLYFKSYQCDLA